MARWRIFGMNLLRWRLIFWHNARLSSVARQTSATAAVNRVGAPCSRIPPSHRARSIRFAMQERNNDRQLPTNEEVFLDHLGHFVPDPEAGSRALIRAGFAPTPASVGVNPDASPT